MYKRRLTMKETEKYTVIIKAENLSKEQNQIIRDQILKKYCQIIKGLIFFIKTSIFTHLPTHLLTAKPFVISLSFSMAVKVAHYSVCNIIVGPLRFNQCPSLLLMFLAKLLERLLNEAMFLPPI